MRCDGAGEIADDLVGIRIQSRGMYLNKLEEKSRAGGIRRYPYAKTT